MIRFFLCKKIIKFKRRVKERLKAKNTRISIYKKIFDNKVKESKKDRDLIKTIQDDISQKDYKILCLKDMLSESQQNNLNIIIDKKKQESVIKVLTKEKNVLTKNNERLIQQCESYESRIKYEFKGQ